jgi:hypothetical protein
VLKQFRGFMPLELAQKIIDLNRQCNYADEDTVKLKLDYVGRVGHRPEAAIVGLSACQIATLAIDNADSFVDVDGDPIYFLGNMSQDSFGLTTIVY